MKKIVELYSEAYRKHGRSPASLLIPKGRQYERFKALTAPMHGEGFSVLDFGCGFGDLKSYLDARFRNVRYTGADITPQFIEECRKIHGAETDFRVIDQYTNICDQFDYVVISGAFNTLYTETREQHWEMVKSILRHLFSCTRKTFAFDFMIDDVDFTSPGAYHQNPIEVYSFAVRELSKRLTLDRSYMPFEFAIIVHRDATIQRPDNVYRTS